MQQKKHVKKSTLGCFGNVRRMYLAHFSQDLRLGIDIELFASAMLPGVAQLQQMRERPWNGVQFSEDCGFGNELV